MNTWTRSVLFTIGAVLAACGDPPPADGDAGPARLRTAMIAPSAAPCPTGSTLTYESFGAPFFESYCVRCHASTLTGSTARNGAPAGYDFDTHAGVMARVSDIDGVAGGGPTRVNIFMPLGAPMPSDAERDMLGEWLACGAP